MADSTCGRHPSDLCQRFLCGTRRPLSAQQNIRVHFSSEQIFRDSRFSDSFQCTRCDKSSRKSRYLINFATVCDIPTSSRVPIVDSEGGRRTPTMIRASSCSAQIGCQAVRVTGSMYIDGSISSGLSRAWSRAYMRASVEAAGPHRGGGQHLRPTGPSHIQTHSRGMGATYTYQITHDHRLRGARHGTAPDVSHLTRL